MRILLYPNLEKKNCVAVLKDALCVLHTLKVNVMLDASLCPLLQEFREKAVFGDFDTLAPEADCILTIGGDGTLIHCAKRVLHTQKPLLGLNVGKLGFLALLDPDELSLLRCLTQGAYAVEERMLLQVTLDRKGGCARRFSALNDAVVGKNAPTGIAGFRLTCGGAIVSDLRADGMIFSTPTGSTAYSLSTGGPIVDPRVESILVSQICPHSLSARPMLFDARRTLELSIPDTTPRMSLSVDGEEPVMLEPGDRIVIQRAKEAARFICLHGKDFYDVLNKKLKGR